jgi:N-acetylglucosaminyl-diphospho-decaprenol L-rhamnosyltransferase
VRIERDWERPDLSVIVVNYESAQLTMRALADAARSAGRLAIEEIIIDAGSSHEDLMMLRERRPRARIIELGVNRGFAAGSNAGIALARGRHLLMLNPDAFAQGDAVEALVGYLDRHSRTGLVVPLLFKGDSSPQDNAHRRFPNLLTLFVDFCTPVAFLVRGRRIDPHHVPRAWLTKPRRIAHANGAVMVVRAEAVVATGPLDEGFFLYLEETEWQRRMAGAGWERAVLPSARFTHLGGASSSGFALASPHYLASVCRYYKHPRVALAVIGAAAVISSLTVRVVIALGFGSERMRTLDGGFSELLALLRPTMRRCPSPAPSEHEAAPVPPQRRRAHRLP